MAFLSNISSDVVSLSLTDERGAADLHSCEVVVLKNWVLDLLILLR